MDDAGISQQMSPRTPTSDFADLSIGEGEEEHPTMPPVTRSETARRRSQLQAQYIISPPERYVHFLQGMLSPERENRSTVSSY